MRFIFLACALFCAILAGCVNEKPIGGDTDEHGCLPAAGYSWCELKQKCLRLWEEPCDSALNLSQARAIAKNSSCMDIGNMTNTSSYNNYTKTWWLDLDTIKPGCSPACVIYENDSSAEVNWRCTGLIPPENDTQVCSKPCHIYIGSVDYSAEPVSCISSSGPLICTMEYRSGDVCLRYVNCTAESGSCKTTEDPKFMECITCFEDAISDNETSAEDCQSKFQD